MIRRPAVRRRDTARPRREGSRHGKEAHPPGSRGRRRARRHCHDDRGGGWHHAAREPRPAHHHADQARGRDHRREPQLRQRVRDLPAAGPPEDLEPAVRGHRHQERRPRAQLRQGGAAHRRRHQDLHRCPRRSPASTSRCPGRTPPTWPRPATARTATSRTRGSRRTCRTGRTRSPSTCPTSTATWSTRARASASSTAPTWATRCTASTRCGSRCTRPSDQLQTWVANTAGDDNGAKPPEPTDQGSVSMGFYNMAEGDAPILHDLALNYAISDNYHQAVQGGTGANHIALGTGFAASYQNKAGKAVRAAGQTRSRTPTPSRAPTTTTPRTGTPAAATPSAPTPRRRASARSTSTWPPCRTSRWRTASPAGTTC